MKTRLFSIALLLSTGLSACADTRTGYPSLAQRPVEREVMQADAAPPVPAATPAPLPASADIVQIVTSARTADAAFRAAIEKGRRTIETGRTAAEGSETWVSAQQAYSDVDVARMPVADALAELDRRREAATTAGDSAGEAAIGAALGEIQELYDAESALLATLMPA